MDDLQSLDRRLAYLEDRLQVLELVSRYARHLDGNLPEDEMLATYTDDAVLESPAIGRVEGKKAIAEWLHDLTTMKQTLRMRHLLTNLHLELDGDRATVKAYMLETVTYKSPVPGRGSSTEVAFAGDYTLWARKQGGEWLVERRLAELDQMR